LKSSSLNVESNSCWTSHPCQACAAASFLYFFIVFHGMQGCNFQFYRLPVGLLFLAPTNILSISGIFSLLERSQWSHSKPFSEGFGIIFFHDQFGHCSKVVVFRCCAPYYHRLWVSKYQRVSKFNVFKRLLQKISWSLLRYMTYISQL